MTKIKCLTAVAFAALFQFAAAQDFAKELASASHAQDIVLSEDDRQRVSQMTLNAALAWHGSSPWISAVDRGARETFESMGVEVLVSTDAQYDPAKQVADIENIQALQPDLVLSLVVDGVGARSSYQRLVDAGTKLVLLSNPIPGFVHGEDYVGIVTDDMQGMGRRAAEEVNRYLNGEGQVGYIFHDANYFITNTRDQAFLEGLQQYPGIDVAISRGFVQEHDTSAIASAMMLVNPNLDVIYVAWDAAAEGVIESLRSDGHSDVRVISHDLGVSNLLDMAQQGNMLASISDRPYDIGVAMAKLAVLSKLGREAPLFTVVSYDLVNQNNIAEIWQKAYQSDLPAIIDASLN